MSLPTRRRFKNRLRKHRRLMGYSQTEVAWLLQLKDSSNISRWEKGITMPSSENLLKLAFLYRTLADQLYFDLSLEVRQALNEKERALHLRKHTRIGLAGKSTLPQMKGGP